jgi:HD-like signal output (HDOD) protein
MTSPRDHIIELLGNMTQLPTINKTVKQVQKEIARQPETASSNAAISAIIEKDLGLSAKILKIANSVFYAGRYGRTGNVQQAIARLGLDEVERVCITVGYMQMFKGSSGYINMMDFWKHSVGVAVVMRHLSKCGNDGSIQTPNAYAIGLFHDVGVLVFDKYFTDAYNKVWEAGKYRDRSLFALERDILGLDHGEIGSMLIERWHLPEEIAPAVAWHHEPDSCPQEYRKLAQLVHVANFVCSTLGIPEPGDNAIQESSIGAWHDIGFDTIDLNAVAEMVKESIEQSGAFVSLSL